MNFKKSMVFIILIAMFLFAGFGQVSADKYGGTAVFRILGEPSAFIPFVAGDTIYGLVSVVLTEPIVRLGLDNQWEPKLAESWEISDDGTVYTFHLREDAMWHDGTPVTSDDVIFTYNLVMDVEAGIAFRTQQLISGEPVVYEKVDDRTFQVILPEPFAPYLSFMITPVPKHIWEDVDPRNYKRTSDPDFFVSSGPFKFVEYRAGEYIRFKRNDNYWGGKPYLDEIVFRIIPDNNAAAIALESGQVNFTDVASIDFRRMINDTRIQTFQKPSGNVQFLCMNNAVFPFDDVLVRKAVQHLINREAIVNQVMLGFALPARNFMVPTDMFYNEDVIVKYDHNIEKAKELLAEAGFTPRRDGILEKDGKALEFDIIFTSGNTEREQASLIMQSDFAQTGIKVNLRSLEWSAIIDILNSTERPHPYQALIIGNTLGPDPTRYRLVYHSGSDAYPAYSNPQADMLFDQGDREFDFNKRQEIYEELQKVITDDAAVGWLWYAQTLYAASANLNLEEAELTGLAHLRFLSPHRIYLD